MLRVEPSLFSNVITAVQRTSSLTGGSVVGLPNGVVIEGLKGVNSFGSDVAEAQKEFQLGRVRSALERIKQIESHFNGIASRWTSTVNSVISSAKQGRHQLSIQKLNEVRNAQTKMRQLTGPASKAFQDLVSALEHAVSMEGRSSQDVPEEPQPAPVAPVAATTTPVVDQPVPEKTPEEQTPDVNLLGPFATNYHFGDKVKLRKGADNKVRLIPKLEKNKFYFLMGFHPPRVVRIRELNRDSLLVFDTHHSQELLIESHKLKSLLLSGIWALVSKNPVT
ncbi:MAG: hypothetical protein MI861_03940 [Pirellulales bacterium]|nr:hypothetical protein [Pirellulales bacterium]